MRRKEIGIIVAGVLLGVLFLLTDRPKPVQLVRPDYGEEDARQSLYYERDSGESGELEVCIPARTYTKEELDELVQEAFARLEESMTGQNANAATIGQDLTLVDRVESMPFLISWWSDTPELISDQGEVYNDALMEPEQCVLTAELRFEDYTKTRQYTLTVIPKQYSEQEQFAKKLTAALQACIQEDTANADDAAGTDTVTLPETVLDARIYSSKPENAAWLFFPFAAVCAVIYMRAHAKQAEKEAGQKEQQALLEAYPAFVNRLALYMASGMTIRTAMDQIRELYSHKTGCEAVLGRRLEHMLLRMQNGVSECRAYQEFGKLCEHQQYQKLMAVLIQTVEMGGKGVLNRLTELEEDAFVLRKEQARVKGETASTKLLFPMVLLLAVVMVLLMVPGFYGIGDVM